MTHNAPAPSGGGKGGLKTVMGTIVLLIVVLFAISKCNGAEQKAGETLAREGVRPPAQTAPRAEAPAQVSAPDPCSGHSRTVTAPSGTERSPWVSIPQGYCTAQSSEGRNITYGVECLGRGGRVFTDGVCVGEAVAERYYSLSSTNVQVRTTFVHNPPN